MRVGREADAPGVDKSMRQIVETLICLSIICEDKLRVWSKFLIPKVRQGWD